ncbi:MAG: hypothetical protein JEZ11_06180 [Desulfobacterales bacterium]|nr:hypothetical protein [Desulfobacterales bacterium]
MKHALNRVIGDIEDQFMDEIEPGSKFYLEVDIGKRAEQMGLSGLAGDYRNTGVVVPLKRPAPGMKVRVDGRTFVRYAQFDSGIAVAEHVARETGLPYRHFVPNDSMILNFA